MIYNRILIISKQQDLIDTLSHYLSELNVQIHIANNENDVLSISSNVKPSILILDLESQSAEPLRLFEQIKHSLNYPIFSIAILQEGAIDSDAIQKISHAGLSVLIQKPLDRLKAIAMVKQFMSMSKVYYDILANYEKAKHHIDFYQLKESIQNALFRDLEVLSLEELFEKALDIIFTYLQSHFKKIGAIFLLEEGRNELVLKAQRGLPKKLAETCARFSVNRCFCGSAVLSKNFIFTDSSCRDIEESHCQELSSEGHYCAPILLDKRGVGVIKLFLKNSAQIDYEQSDLLTFIAKLLAEIIKAKKIADNIKKLHNDLRVLQENFQSIVTKSVDGIIIIDMQGVVQFANPAAKLLFGYLANSLIGMKFGIPSLTKEFIEIHIMRFSGEMGVAEMSVVETEWRGQPAFLAILHDITERKKMEEIIREKSNRLEELNKDLENTIREEVEKRRKHEQLLIQQSKLSAMGEMLGAIAHQWRQPLNAISILIQDIKLANQHGELDNDYINETVKTAKEQVRFLSQTIDDFRNFYKPCKEKSGFDVCNAILEILSLVNPQLVVSSIDVTVQTRDKDNRLLKTIAEMFTRYDHMDEHFIVLGYPNEFKQVILNLVNNARDAILEFRQQKKLDKGRIDILIKEEHKKVVIHVKDNGGGIPDHILDKIFIPYFTTKPFGQGTGIGLYMSKVIIESNMDGKLFAEVHDTDTIFTIELKKE